MKVVLFISLFLFSFFGVAQELTYRVNGKITNNDTKKMEAGVTVTFSNNGKVLGSVVTASNGKYEIRAVGPMGGNFQLTYSKPGFVSKKVGFNGAKMTEEDIPAGIEFPLPTIDMDLFTERPNADFSFLNSEPVASFFWDETNLMLSYDKDASAKTKKKIDDLLASSPPVAAGPSPEDLKFQAIMKEAEALYTQKKYEEAIIKYEEAATIKPKDPVALAKISEIDKLLKAKRSEELAKQSLENEYKNLILAGDNLRDQKKYTEAVLKYSEALKKKDDPYPKGEVSKINTLLAEQKSKEIQFENLKKEGFSLATSKQWTEAKSKLESAIAIKPDNVISQKIKEIDGEIAKLASEKEKTEQYNAAMTAADGLLSSGKLNEAKAKYTEASLIEPNQVVPKQKITEINNLLADQANSAAKKAKVDKLIAEGAAAVSKNDYPLAKIKYEEVLKEDPANALAKTEIQQIDAKLLAQKGQAEKDQKFELLKQEGMSLATAKKYAEAKTKLEQAIAIKQDPAISQKIIEIDNLIKQNQSQLALDEEYKKIVDAAQILENEKKYDDAIAKFKEASIKKPNEGLPKAKIIEIEKLKQMESKLNSEKVENEKHLQFDVLRKEGLALFSIKKYSEAKTKLEQAIAIKPDILLSQKITEIDNILKSEQSQLALDEEFKKLISEAGSLEASKNYDGAISKYKEASIKKPAEVLPKNKITELEKIKKSIESEAQAQNQKNTMYNGFITKGNKNFSSKNYELALKDFQDALNVKPDDSVAQAKISEIKQLLDDLQKTKNQTTPTVNNFDKLYEEADKLFGLQKYMDAKKVYEKILSIESSEKRASDRVEECIKLEKEKGLVEADNGYKKLITAADNKFNDKNYLKAKEYYERALKMRNTDPYPKQKIDEIDAILNPKPVVTDNKVEIDPEKLQPLGIPFKKTIIDAKDELKKAEIARQTARNNELNSGIQNVNDRANELGDKKHEEQLTTSKSVYYINSDIEKSFISNDAGHQDVIELNKKVTKELLDFEDNSNVLENSDHLNIQDKIDIMVQENSLEYDDKNIAFVGKGDVLKKHNTEYTDALVLESQKYNDKTVDTKQEILSTEHKILEKQIDDKESRIAVEKRIETTVDKTTQKNEDLNNNETDEILNSKIQLVSAEKKLGDKIENDMKNSNEISVDIASIKHKVQASVDEGNEHKTEESNNITNQIVDLNKKLANEALQQKDDLQNSTESLKNTNKVIQDNLNDEYNEEMVKYLASKNKIEGKVNKVYEDNTVSNEKLIDHNETIKDLATNLSDENGKQAQDNNEKLLSAQQSLHDSKTDNSAEKPIIANSIGKEYPEGVSQESFTQNDENGLMKAIITRRVVVVGGKGDVYVRTQTLSTITYSKNGSPSSERVWQKETQNPNLVKHY